jgi:hypothetical protein
MRGLAEFIMRGRWQALAVAVLGSGSLLFGWISAAAIALVTLRKGTASGGWLVLWAMLPAAIVAAMSGDMGSVMLLLVAFCLSVILRETVSLSLALIASVPLAMLGGLALIALNGPFLEDLVATFNEALRQLEQDMTSEQQGELAFTSLAVPQVGALLAIGNTVVAVLAVLLGRYWQALLYNPGGFGKEFRALRLPQGAVVSLVALGTVLWLQGDEWRVWSAVAVMPLTVVGFALVHAYAAHTDKGVTWLTLMYTLWIVLDPIKWVWLGFVMADVFVDFRARWQNTSGGDSGSD